MNPLENVESWLYLLGNVGPKRIDQIALSHADLVVIDHAHGDNVPFEANELQEMRGDNSKLMISYLSIGEAETYRSYWEPSWDKSPPGFLGEENPEWEGNIKVKYWQPAWRKIIFNYLDQIVDQGFDGAYLDIIDAYYYWEDKAPRSGDFYRRKMIEFVEDIRAHADARLEDQGKDLDFAIIGQNGEDLADYGRYLKAVDGIGKEDLYFFYRNGQPGKFDDVPKGWLSGSKELLTKAAKAGVKVMVIEYVPPRFAEKAEQGLVKEINYLKGLGAPLYVAEERDLSKPYVIVSTDGVARQMGGNAGDRLEGGVWADLIAGRGGDDLLIGWGGQDELAGGSGKDELRGIDGNDLLFGGAGADVLKGGSGADRIVGGRGKDLAVGGHGADEFVFASGDGRLTVRDFGDGRDRLDLSDFGLAGVAEFKAHATIQGADIVFEFGDDRMILKNTNLADIGAGDLIL